MNDLLLTDENVLYLIYLGIGLGVMVAFSALLTYVGRGETAGEARSRRMQMIHEGRSIEERLALLKPAATGRGMARMPILGTLPIQLRRAGLSVAPPVFLALCLCLAVLTFAVLVLRVQPFLAAGVALLIGFGVPLVALRIRGQAQTRALTAQLPDALDLMARGLRIGHPLSASINAVAQQMADPIGSEFGLVFDQVNYGDDLPEAFQDFAERVDIEDVYYLSSSIGIQHGTGSDLAKVIEILSKVVRSRAMLRRKIHAISAEGRLTAGFLSVMPVLMFTFTSITAPTYFGGVMDDPLFMPMAVTVVFLTVLNAVVMNRLVNFHV
jgi:tight adherence protein B